MNVMSIHTVKHESVHFMTILPIYALIEMIVSPLFREPGSSTTSTALTERHVTSGGNFIGVLTMYHRPGLNFRNSLDANK